jgi:hypothetical protein
MFKWLFLAISLLSFPNCNHRADYNLPLGLFFFLIWPQTSPVKSLPLTQYTQKARVLYLLLLSNIADLVWFASYLLIWKDKT